MAEYWSVDVNNDLRPAYYDEFRCLASDCRFSCCKGWNISFNKKDFLSLKRQTGSEGLSQILRGGVRRIRSGSKEGAHYGEFDMRGSVCPLLDEDSLCLLQKECGHSALPDVCKTFPRRCVPLASGYLERSLTPACEGVLQLLWEQPEGIAFLSDPLPKQERKRVIEKDTDTLFPGDPRILHRHIAGQTISFATADIFDGDGTVGFSGRGTGYSPLAGKSPFSAGDSRQRGAAGGDRTGPCAIPWEQHPRSSPASRK